MKKKELKIDQLCAQGRVKKNFVRARVGARNKNLPCASTEPSLVVKGVAEARENGKVGK